MSKLKGTIPLDEAIKVAEMVEKWCGIGAFTCGSVRRQVKLVGDVDVVAIDTQELRESLSKIGFNVKNAVAEANIDSVPVSVYFANWENWGSMIMHFTGSKELNIMMRRNAIKKGLMLNQYGLFDNGVCIASKTEEEIYEKLGMKYLPPIERSKKFGRTAVVKVDDEIGNMAVDPISLERGDRY